MAVTVTVDASGAVSRWHREGNPMSNMLEGKTVLITGASSGIGRATAERLAAAGAHVLLVARSADKLEAVRREIQRAGGVAHVFSADLSDLASCDALVKEVTSSLGGVDVLINNAGRSIRRSLLLSQDRFHDFERTMQLNYFGALRLVFGFLPAMREQRHGQIVNVSRGFARNYLLPRKLALLATPGNLKQVERERVKFDAKEAEEKGAAENIAAKMSSIEIVISRRVGETEALYGSVTSADIAEELAKKGFDVDKRKVGLREPIKKLGSLTVPVKLHREVILQLPVKVVAEGKPEATPAELKAADADAADAAKE